MRVGISGSGLMGRKLGTVFARAGHEVGFSLPIWFVWDDGKLYLLPVTGSDTQWYKERPQELLNSDRCRRRTE